MLPTAQPFHQHVTRHNHVNYCIYFIYLYVLIYFIYCIYLLYLLFVCIYLYLFYCSYLFIVFIVVSSFNHSTFNHSTHYGLVLVAALQSDHFCLHRFSTTLSVLA